MLRIRLRSLRSGSLPIGGQLGPEVSEVKAFFQAKGGSPNGGTMATALHTWDTGAVQQMRDPFLLTPEFHRPPSPVERDPVGSHFDADIKAWVDAGWFRCEFFARTHDGRTARSLVAGQGDPANRITVTCLCESALALAINPDRLPARAGVLTPSTGLAEVLIDRLSQRGIAFTRDPAA